MGTGDIPPIGIATFGHFLVQRAGTGERGGGKGAAQGGRRPPDRGAATQTLRPEVPKSCNPDRPEDEISVSLGSEVCRDLGHALALSDAEGGTGDRSDRNRYTPLHGAPNCDSARPPGHPLHTPSRNTC